MTEQEYFAKTIANKEGEYKALSPQQQYITYKAIVEYGYEQGEIEQKPNTIKEDIEDFATEWLQAWKELQNRNNMKLKDLLSGRDKLRKYDELKEWKEKFEGDTIFVPQTCDKQVREWAVSLMPLPLPTHIKAIIITALEAEIAKLDEE